MIPHADEDGLHDASTDVADGEDLVLSPGDRVQHDGRPDVRDDEKKLQKRAQLDRRVRPATGDVPRRVIESGHVEKAAGIDVRNVMTNSTPKIRAVVWSSSIRVTPVAVGVAVVTVMAPSQKRNSPMTGWGRGLFWGSVAGYTKHDRDTGSRRSYRLLSPVEPPRLALVPARSLTFVQPARDPSR